MIKFLLILKNIIKYSYNPKRFNKQFNNQPLKLHLGCGTVYKDSWINIDNNSDSNIQKLDLKYDLRKGIPFKDSSVDYIYNEYFLEHLSVKEGQSFLK